MSTLDPRDPHELTRGRHRGLSADFAEPRTQMPPVPRQAFAPPPSRSWQPPPVTTRAHENRSATREPIRPSDPWPHARPEPTRPRVELSLILAALAMISLAIGVIVGVAML